MQKSPIRAKNGEPEAVGFPLVSIGMPVYNAVNWVERALDSLIAQDYFNIEVLISDNASTDGTSEIFKRYSLRHPNISVVRLESNIGPQPNFQAVVARAKGKYFMWAAADDWWAPEFVSSLMNELEAHPEAGVAMSAVERVDESGARIDTMAFGGGKDPNRRGHLGLLLGLTAQPIIKYNLFVYGLFRTELLQRAAAQFPEVPSAERILLIQVALVSRFRYVDRVLTRRTVHRALQGVRLPEEKFNKVRALGFWGDLITVAALAGALVRSKVVPRHRKVIYLPLAVVRYTWFLLSARLFILPYRRGKGRLAYLAKAVQRWVRRLVLRSS